MGFKIRWGTLLSYQEEPGVTVVRIPGRVKKIGKGAFRDCTGLTAVTIPEGVRRICFSAFSGCKNLTSVQLPGSLTVIEGYAFSGCQRLTSVTIPDSVTEIEHCVFGGCKQLASVVIPDTVERIGDKAFAGTPWLEEQKEEFVIAGKHVLIRYNGGRSCVQIPDSVRQVNASVLEHLKKVTYRGMTLEALGTMHRVNDLQIMCSMMMNGQYDRHRIEVLRQELRDMYDGWGVPESTMYPLLWQLFPLFPEEPELLDYAREYLDEMMCYLIDKGNIAAVEAVCKNGTLLTADNIDSFITYANRQGQLEIQLMLMNYKKEHIGYDADTLTL